MLSIGTEAQAYFRGLIEKQDTDELGVRLQVIHAGTPKADCELNFCGAEDLNGDEWEVQCDGFTLYVDANSAAYLDAATINYETSATGGQLSIKAPHIKGKQPNAESSVVERVRWVLESEINPSLASHGGRVSLEEITAEGVAILRFGGGCHGCGMVDVTLREGIETTLRTQVPEITEVRDATDHSTGANPYMTKA